ncbi:MAG: Thymidylate kinase [Chlamydiales bacterium]|nr:Thymidylate kinase [Chlamydiales bacterium]MCH9635850.1 Thymidylate kinase [Chlamydiales bacterium]
MTREPGGTRLSEKMREVVLDSESKIPICERAEMMLYLTARVQQLHERILPALHEGAFVICDRFNDSTLAYQAYARRLGFEEVEKICNLVCENVTPDCTLLLDLDPKVGLSRLDKRDRLESEAFQFHLDVRQGYLHLHDHYPDRIKLIDASQSEAKVFEDALNYLCLNV